MRVSDKLQFTIDDFSGPLDLLLHLVKESKMDIYEIPIEHITKEYIDFIEKMESMNIDVASEYLVVASELIHLKSKMLLNIKDEDEESNQLEFKIGTEEELRKRLIEYKRYKELCEDLKKLESTRSEVYTKVPESLEEYREDVKLNTDITIEDLIDAMNEFLERQKYIKPLSTKINFFDLFDEPTRSFIVVTFLSILEMAKNKEINIRQDTNFSNIILEAK